MCPRTRLSTITYVRIIVDGQSSASRPHLGTRLVSCNCRGCWFSSFEHRFRAHVLKTSRAYAASQHYTSRIHVCWYMHENLYSPHDTHTHLHRGHRVLAQCMQVGGVEVSVHDAPCRCRAKSRRLRCDRLNHVKFLHFIKL